MKRTRAWSKKGTPVIVTVPTTRAKITTILGAISPSGLVKVSLRIPRPVKKRKAGQKSGHVSSGTVTGHYISFFERCFGRNGQISTDERSLSRYR